VLLLLPAAASAAGRGAAAASPTSGWRRDCSCGSLDAFLRPLLGATGHPAELRSCRSQVLLLLLLLLLLVVTGVIASALIAFCDATQCSRASTSGDC
jgi:hypothetical protein